MQIALARSLTRVERMSKVIENSNTEAGELDGKLHGLRMKLMKLDERLNGNRAKQEVGEKFKPIVQDRLFAVSRGVDRSTYGPTPTHRRSLEIADAEIAELQTLIESAQQEVTNLLKELIDAGGPWIEGQPLPSSGN